VIGKKWTLLIVREAFWGRTRFSEFREPLGVSSDIRADRLGKVVQHDIPERQSYQEDGARERFSYHLIDARLDLSGRPAMARVCRSPIRGSARSAD
jgi:DNA-binding HxlR family transcriptional regulator